MKPAETATIMTYSGRRVDVLALRPSDIDIEDIAHSLSLQCRFGGHCREFISVAQHSVNVSLHCDPEDALWGLLHDAPESFLTDIPKPVKVSVPLKGYRRLEAILEAQVASRFGLSLPIPKSVKDADCVELLTEWESFKPLGGLRWNGTLSNYTPRPEILVSWAPAVAKRRFLERFEELTQK